ncbi:hypothetical protein JCM3765_004999 [Sporobolomyces pararoseus]
MPTRQLPPELLSEILSILTSSPSNLYHCLLVSRAFYFLAKPFLYSRITIRTKKQRQGLSEVREGDKQLVKKITILGDRQIETSNVEEHFEGGECILGKNVVRDLLVGKLLDISVIERLQVRLVHEEPFVEFAGRRASSGFKPALNLKELSIWNHQGGGDIWEAYLEKYVPSLRRLAYWQVTTYDLELVGDLEACLLELKAPLPRHLPYSQISVLITSPPIETPPNFLLDNSLALVKVKHYHSIELYTSQFQNIRLLNNSQHPDLIYRCLEGIAKSVSAPENRLTHLYLPSHVTTQVAMRLRPILKGLEEKGIKLILDRQKYTPDSLSLFLPSFIIQLQRDGKLGSD